MPMYLATFWQATGDVRVRAFGVAAAKYQRGGRRFVILRENGQVFLAFRDRLYFLVRNVVCIRFHRLL